MKDIISSYSYNLVNDLCREIDYIKARSTSIKNSLINCQNKSISLRLENELNDLKTRLNSIKRLTLSISDYSNNSLSIRFLNELLGRSLLNIQIK